jgi:transposase
MNLPCLGIDIAKVKFNACLLQANGKLKHKVFANSVAGFAQLLQWLEKLEVKQVHACSEATGTYGEALSLYPHQQGHPVSVMNPAAIKAFAASPLSRTKTDRSSI